MKPPQHITGSETIEEETSNRREVGRQWTGFYLHVEAVKIYMDLLSEVFCVVRFFSFSWNIITHCTDIRNKIVFVALWFLRDRTKVRASIFLFPQVIRTLQSSLFIKHWTKDIWLNLFKCKRRSDKDVELLAWACDNKLTFKGT